MKDEIDYDVVNKIIDERKEASIEYLRQVIKENQRSIECPKIKLFYLMTKRIVVHVVHVGPMSRFSTS